jgi:small conductance mechanosensitive channel
MKTSKKALFVLLVLVSSWGSSFAQDGQTAETRNVASLAEALNTDISELQFFSSRVATAAPMEREVLVYRQDERRFKLLTDFDNLVSELAKLPDGTAQKADTLAKLAVLGDGVGNAVFERIQEFRQAIIQSNEKLESLSGGALVAAQATIQSMESIRIKYYEALVNHLESRKTLGLSSDELRRRLDPELYFFAETLAGQIELTNTIYSEVQASLKNDPGNADKTATLIDLDGRHKIHVSRLETIILVLDQLELDSSVYKAVMLQQADGFSVSFFSLAAISSVFKESWATLKGAISENAGDISFRLFLFIAVLVVFRILSRIVKRVVRAACDRSSLDLSALLKNILVSTSGGTIMAVGILMCWPVLALPVL